MPHKVAAKDRAPAFPVSQLPGSLPKVDIPDNTDAHAVVKTALNNLSSGLPSTVLTKDALWRDMFSLTGTLRCFFSGKVVAAAWSDRVMKHDPTNFQIVPNTVEIVRRGPYAWVKGMFSFVTHGKPNQICSGFVNIVPSGEGSSPWKIWGIATILERIHGLGNVDVLEPQMASHSDVHEANLQSSRLSNSTVHGVVEAIQSGFQTRSIDYDCVICGGGQAGLSIAGRLKAGGVQRHLVLEKFDVIGGNWLNRYDSVKLHTSKDISQLPFGRIFPEEDPYYLTGRHLARGYQRFVDRFNLNVWTSTSLELARYNEQGQFWELEILRSGAPCIITAKHLVLAIGPGGTVPKMPNFPNREEYKGCVLHSAEYKNPFAFRGKKAVIIGSANTAHDVAEDMVNAGLESVTLVQRSPTCVIPTGYMRKNVEPLYNLKSDIELTDRMIMASPTSIQRIMMNSGLNAQAQAEPERFDALEARGFKVRREVDMIHILFERVGGHYMDVGTSQKVIDGLIKVKSDASVTGYTEDGLSFSDGSELEADVIVFGTGFETNPRDQIIKIIGPDMESQLEDMWQCNSEGEIRGMWKPIGHPGIWYAGGGISSTRFHSRFLALQIQADLAGTPLEVYDETPEV